MNPLISAALVATINGAFELWRIHANQPEGWKPTHEDYLALLAEVDAATKEARLEAARVRLNLAEPQSPPGN